MPRINLNRFKNGRMAPRLFVLLAALCLLAWVPAQAQTTYKCGNTYSQKPCEGGTAVDASDKRSADQKAQAQNMSEREKQAGNQLERDRVAKGARDAAALKKASSEQKVADAKAKQTKLRPIKNKKEKTEKAKAASRTKAETDTDRNTKKSGTKSKPQKPASTSP